MKTIAIFGGGPAGLMAAEVLAEAGFKPVVFEAMPTVARKFLLAGKSGLNITHSEPEARFLSRFGDAGLITDAVSAFLPSDLRRWADDLGADTFIGSSGRVFPKAMKASPLLRAWLARLRALGVEIRTRHRWIGMADGRHRIAGPDGEERIEADAAVLAFGGASWPRLGSDAAWVPMLRSMGVGIEEFRPANCGFEREWSENFRSRFAGSPVKSVVAKSAAGEIPGEFVISSTGIEGSLVYAHAKPLREQIDREGQALLTLDLAPGRREERIGRDLAILSPKVSLSNRLRKTAGLDAVKIALLRECDPQFGTWTPDRLAALVKEMPLMLHRPRPIAEAISSAGGISLDEIDERFMLRTIPGLFVAGEMLDWEAPTGGYLLTACFATGRRAADGVIAYLKARP